MRVTTQFSPITRHRIHQRCRRRNALYRAAHHLDSNLSPCAGVPRREDLSDYAVTTANDTNLIVNGDFTYGFNLWRYRASADNSADATFTTTDVPDEHLRAALDDAIGKSFGEITDVDTDLTTLLNILDDTHFASVYAQVLEPKKLEWTRLRMCHNSLTNTSLSSIAELQNLEYLQLGENPSISGLSALTALTNLENLIADELAITDRSPLRTLYNAGAFRGDDTETNSESCGLDLSTGTTNRSVIDYLVNAGVDVAWESGNTVN